MTTNWTPYTTARHTLKVGTLVRYWNFYFNCFLCGKIIRVMEDHRGNKHYMVHVPITPDNRPRTYVFYNGDLTHSCRTLQIGL